jgi:hypothetical protein
MFQVIGGSLFGPFTVHPLALIKGGTLRRTGPPLIIGVIEDVIWEVNPSTFSATVLVKV